MRKILVYNTKICGRNREVLHKIVCGDEEFINEVLKREIAETGIADLRIKDEKDF